MDKNSLKAIQTSGLENIAKAINIFELEQARIISFGKKGQITQALKSLKDLPKEGRGEVGEKLNQIKKTLQQALEEKRKELENSKKEEWFDKTLPGKKPTTGHLHLTTQAIFEIEDILTHLGFVRRRYPEIDTEKHVFDDLNMPPNHPARDEFESFFLEQDGMVLTTHTSNGQLHEMLKGKLPIRMTNIGRCYRPESNISHYPVFHQFEGLAIDTNVSIAELKGTLTFFAKNFFSEDREIRLRPYDFRFTEPSFEVDISCGLCGGKGCKFCKEGWVELGGAGMVHRHVLEAGGMNPNKVSGFAFGWGVERVMLMKEGLNIPDIRMLWGNDLNFLQQF